MRRNISLAFIKDCELSIAEKRISWTAQSCNIQEKLRISRGHKLHATNVSDKIVLEKENKSAGWQVRVLYTHPPSFTFRMVRPTNFIYFHTSNQRCNYLEVEYERCHALSLVKKWRKMFFRLVRSVGQRKKF